MTVATECTCQTRSRAEIALNSPFVSNPHSVADPLTQFTIVLAALLHDVDHDGVPNAVLKKEQSDDSNAERHSIDLAFEILMEPKYRELRFTIYRDEAEMRRFRQLLVHTIMSTDIADKQLKELREKRWKKTSEDNKPENVTSGNSPKEEQDRKATLAIEALIQASDVLHTMQPFDVYKQWNERLFVEMYKAYKEGRTDVDPGTFWYKGEIGFFDFYVIPLARKLQQCQVFGTMGDECLGFARANRQAWMLKGPSAVNSMIRKVQIEENATHWTSD